MIAVTNSNSLVVWEKAQRQDVTLVHLDSEVLWPNQCLLHYFSESSGVTGSKKYGRGRLVTADAAWRDQNYGHQTASRWGETRGGL